MLQILFACARTGQFVPTGIETDLDTFIARCRRALCWNSIWRNLQRHDVIGSGGEVNWLIDGCRGKRLPAVDLTHVDLTGGKQRPEQHGGSLC